MTVDFFDGVDGVTVTAEAAFVLPGSGYASWGSSLWGRSAWGPGVTYQDLSSRLRGFGTKRSFDQTLDRWQSGSGWALLDNRDGDLSPSNPAGAYVVSSASTILPGRRFRLRAHYGGVTYGLISGVIDNWQEEIISAGPGTGDATVRVSIVDDWAELAAVDGLEVAPEGAGDTFGSRVDRILLAAGFRGARSLDPGEATMQATTLSSGPVAELEATALAEGGTIWPDADGVLQASGRYGLVDSPRSREVQATFGDLDPAHLPYSDPQPAYDRRLLCNVAVYTRTGGTPQTADDDASRARYGLKRAVESALICESDGQALALAQWKVARFREPRRRIDRITVSPRSRPAELWPVVLAARERDLWRVVHHPPGGYTDDVYCHIVGTEHTVQPGGEWTVTVDLWSAEPYLTYSTSRWGVALWGRSKWF